MVRTVTMIYVGTLIDTTEKELILTKAAWIPDSGRWHNFVSDGSVNEVEPYPADKIIIINRGSVLDATEITGDFSKVK